MAMSRGGPPLLLMSPPIPIYVSPSRHVAQVKKERWAEGCVVKDRAEPCHVSRVLRVVAASRGADEADVGAQAFANSARLFRLGVD